MCALSLLSPAKGCTLTEVLIAMVVLAVGLLGLSVMTIATIHSLSFCRDQSTATLLAEDRLEEIKDAIYADLTPLRYPDEDYRAIPGYPAFKRTVSIDTDVPIGNTKRVRVEVAWRAPRGTATYHVSLMTIVSR